MAHDLGLDVILSNPYKTRLIAESKKKTNKVDAHILADLLRVGCIAESHVPGKEVIAARQLVRYRHDKVQQRTQCKNAIHGILLQGAVTIPGSTFSNAYTQTLRKMDDYRITENLKIIDCINDILARVDAKISAAVDGDPALFKFGDLQRANWMEPARIHIFEQCPTACGAPRGSASYDLSLPCAVPRYILK